MSVDKWFYRLLNVVGLFIANFLDDVVLKRCDEKDLNLSLFGGGGWWGGKRFID